MVSKFGFDRRGLNLALKKPKKALNVPF